MNRNFIVNLFVVFSLISINGCALVMVEAIKKMSECKNGYTKTYGSGGPECTDNKLIESKKAEAKRIEDKKAEDAKKKDEEYGQIMGCMGLYANCGITLVTYEKERCLAQFVGKKARVEGLVTDLYAPDVALVRGECGDAVVRGVKGVTFRHGQAGIFTGIVGNYSLNLLQEAKPVRSDNGQISGRE